MASSVVVIVTPDSDDDGNGRGGISPRTTLSRSVATVLGLFLAVGVGLGLASYLGLDFLVVQFVDPGTDPTDNTIVGILLIHAILTPLLLGPLVAGATSLLLGRTLPERPALATVSAAATSAVGFYLMTVVALAITFAVLWQSSGAAAGGAAAGGAGGGSPFDPSALLSLVLRAGIPAAFVGAVAGYVGSRLSAAGDSGGH